MAKDRRNKTGGGRGSNQHGPKGVAADSNVPSAAIPRETIERLAAAAKAAAAPEDPYEFADVLAAADRLQELVPDAVLVGGTAAALYAHHRVSFDHDHVLEDLRDRFDAVLEALEATDGWVTARVKRPVLILGSLDGIETGIRQLIRKRPLEVIDHSLEDGPTLRIPTREETARVKGWLILERNATRDYLDFAAILEPLPPSAQARIVRSMDEYYQDQIGPDGERIATQLVKQLAEPRPYDLSEVDLRSYRHLEPRWQGWDHIAAACAAIAQATLED